MRKTFILLSFAFASIPAGAYAADDVVASGCARPGVGPGCIVMMDSGKTYQISAAKPKPVIGQYGTVKGQVFHGAGLCQQGIDLSPASWMPDPSKNCAQ